MSTVRALSKLHLNSSVVFELDLTDFPEKPTSGEIALKGGILWIYSLIEGVKTWYPLTNYRESFVHTQALESLNWTVNHGFGTPDVTFIVYDANGSHVVPGHETIDSNSFRLTFTSATAGRVIVFADSERFMPSVRTESISTDTMVLSGIPLTTSQFTVGDSSFTSVTVEGRNLAVLDEDTTLPAAVIPETLNVRTLNLAPTLTMTTMSVDKGGATPVEVAAINDQPVALLDETNLKLFPEQIPESIEINDLTADEIAARTLDATETVSAPTGEFTTSLTVGGKAVATQESVNAVITALVDNDTTYAVMTVADANTGAVTDGQVISPAVLKTAIETHAAALISSIDMDGGEL